MGAMKAANWEPWLEAALRSDHAGETGAVAIYRGILAVSRDPALRRFAERHGATEQAHLDRIEAVLDRGARSRLVPLWRLAGFLTGFLPALAGPRAVYATIDAVETFVDGHYAAQITRLDTERSHPSLRAMLETCREEEIHHRDEARAEATRPPGFVLRAWIALVAWGSEAAVAAAMRI